MSAKKNARNREGSDPELNVLVQLRKVISLRNAPPPVLFQNGDEHMVTYDLATTTLSKYAALRSIDHKEAFSREIGTSFPGLCMANDPAWRPTGPVKRPISLGGGFSPINKGG